MAHPDGFAPERPIDVPILIGADGPKGVAVATAIGDGMFSAGRPAAAADDTAAPEWRAVLAFGTVLVDGEQPADERVLDAAGHAMAVVYHAMYERGGGGAVDGLPGGQAWREAIEAVPSAVRHLAVHEDHLVRVTDRDRPAVEAAAPLLPAFTFTGDAAALRNKVAELEAAGVTELAWQPAGPDIPGELARMAEALDPLRRG
jgi:5,10-methylenetetrahydromethanopterin reductase